MRMSVMKLLIVGSGITGCATGIGFAGKGNEPIFYDVDRRKLEDMRARGYSVVETIPEAIDLVDVIFICVPTPTVDKRMDFSFLEDATTKVAAAIKGSEKYRVVVVRSTTLPSTSRSRILPLMEVHSGMKAGRDFGVCANPEFLREDHAFEDFERPARIVIGELDKKSGDTLEALYKPFEAPIYRMDLDSAEIIKYASNMFLATKISFFNEIFLICKELGLNPNLVSQVVSDDPRIGKYGIRGGQPFAGKCLPKDLEAFITFAREKGINPKMFEATWILNRQISDYLKNRKTDS
jgi:UDPglucose 6-dehydrogenase